MAQTSLVGGLVLVLKIIGVRMEDMGREWGGSYTGFPCPDFLKISGAMYPGVPHVVVKT